ncbi:MAG TPA: hypothetical protein VFW98_05695 [Gemmatimonadaceae bacterium]|nr:hypothetical protein [Gemmatimonadaceae bacterium]
MRGSDQPQTAKFIYRSIEDRIPEDHPSRAIQPLPTPILAELSPRFQAMYSRGGRPSIPPERLLRAMLPPTVFTKNRDRLIAGTIADAVLQAILKAADARGLLSHARGGHSL